MSDVFPPNPGRPDVPEFWHLSEIVLRHDGKLEDGGGDGILEALINEFAPVQVVAYMAAQRCALTLAKAGNPAVLPHSLVWSFMSGAWVDAFLAGAEYERKYGEKVSE